MEHLLQEWYIGTTHQCKMIFISDWQTLCAYTTIWRRREGEGGGGSAHCTLIIFSSFSNIIISVLSHIPSWQNRTTMQWPGQDRVTRFASKHYSNTQSAVSTVFFWRTSLDKCHTQCQLCNVFCCQHVTITQSQGYAFKPQGRCKEPCSGYCNSHRGHDLIPHLVNTQALCACTSLALTVASPVTASTQ